MELDFTILIDALNRHSKAIESLIAYSKTTTGALAAAQATPAGGPDPAGSRRGPGRPPKTDTTAASAGASAATTTAVQPSAATSQATATPSTAKGSLVHRDLVESFKAFAKIHGRDGVVKLLGEFGAAEFGQVKLDDLPLFKGRLEGVAQTPTDPSDVSNLLGLA